jgi:LCP family protein required for cell wall assembly
LLRRKDKDQGAQPSGEPATAPRYTARVLSRKSSSERYAKKRRERSRHHGLKVALVSILAVVLAVGLGVGGYLYSLGFRIGTNDQDLLASLSSTSYDQPFYMLLMGVDTGEERLAEGDTGRSDSMMLVRIDPVNVKVTMVSLHRDTLVNIEGYGKGKLNSAYAYGGRSLAVKTVNELAGVNISHYAEVDFDSFTSIVDSIGGITVNLPTDVYDPDYTGLDLKAGEQTLDGNTALLLCRCRHAYDAYGDGDTYRAANQRMVIAAIVKKVLASDPATKVSAISSMADSITTDMSLGDIFGLASQMKDIDFNEDVYTAMTPTEGYYYNGTWYEKLDTAAWDALMQRVDEGLPPYEDSSQDKTQGIAGSVSDAESGSGSESGSGDGSTGSGSSGDGSTGNATGSGTVMVLNGAGTPGLGTSVANRLSALGYDAQSQNAASFDYSKTEVYYNGSENKQRAEAIASSLGNGIVVAANDGSVTTSTDVVVVVGEAQANLAGR